MRSCWVSQMWQNSSEEDMYNSLSLPEDNGWIQIDETYAIDWEATEVQAKVKRKIHFLTKGCNCKKAVKNANCGCRKKSCYCGPGCLCNECANLQMQPSNDKDDTIISSESSSDSDDEILEDMHEEIITEDFSFSTYDII